MDVDGERMLERWTTPTSIEMPTTIHKIVTTTVTIVRHRAILVLPSPYAFAICDRRMACGPCFVLQLIAELPMVRSPPMGKNGIM